jgi:hypothetical protein
MIKINVKIKLLIKPIMKKIPETTLILVVVLGNSKVVPINITNVIVRNIKLPALRSI